MPFEDAKYISELVDTDPVPNDPVNQGDDQLRQIKLALQANVLGDVDGTQLLVANLPALDIAQPGPEFPVMTLGALSQTAKMKLGNVEGDDVLYLDNAIVDALLVLRGAGVNLLVGDPLGQVALMFAGVPALATNAAGAETLGQTFSVNRAGETGSVRVEVLNDDGGANFRFQNGAVEIFTTDPTGVQNERILQYIEGAGAALTFAGTSRLVTAVAGVEHPGTTFDFGQQTDNSILMRLTNLIGGLRFINTSVSGTAQIQQLSNANVFEKNWITMERDGIVALAYDGAETFRTGVGGNVNTGNLSITAPVPTAANQATRQDYVNNWSNGGAPAQLIQVQNMATQNGVQTAVGQNVSVTFDTPFTGNPSITLTVVNPTNANNGFAYLNTLSTTGFTATTGFAGPQVHWQAIGTLGRGL